MSSNPKRARAAFAQEICQMLDRHSPAIVIEWITRRANVEIKTSASVTFLTINDQLATSSQSLEHALRNWCEAARRRAGVKVAS